MSMSGPTPSPPEPGERWRARAGTPPARGLAASAMRLAGYVAAAGVIAFAYLLIGSIPGWRWAGWAAVGWAFGASALLSARFRDILWLVAAVGAFLAIDAAPRWLFPAATAPGTPWDGSAETTAWMLGAMAAGFGAWLGGSARDRVDRVREWWRRR